jgi:hypothetical protein
MEMQRDLNFIFSKSAVILMICMGKPEEPYNLPALTVTLNNGLNT